jgi:hypothetical protein
MPVNNNYASRLLLYRIPQVQATHDWCVSVNPDNAKNPALDLAVRRWHWRNGAVCDIGLVPVGLFRYREQLGPQVSA